MKQYLGSKGGALGTEQADPGNATDCVDTVEGEATPPSETASATA